MSKPECEVCRNRETTCCDCGRKYALVPPNDLIPMDDHGALWKQRYERLRQFMDDIEFEIRDEKMEVADSRAFHCEDLIYVSFSMDVVGTEAAALKVFGAGKYDVYRLERKGSE